MLGAIDSLAGAISQTLKYLAAFLLLVVAALIAIDVSMRFALNRPIIGIAEVVANGIVIIAFLQVGYAVRVGGMLRSELLLGRLGPRGRVVLECIVAILGIALFGLIAWASYDPMMRAIAQNEFEGHASFQVPTWPVKSLIVACSVLAVVNYALVALKAVARGELPGRG